MMKYLLFAICFSVHLGVLAQDCNFDLDKKDPFTGQHVQSSTHKIGPRSWQWSMTLEKSAETHSIAMQFVLQSYITEIFEKGKTVLVKLENGQIIQLVADKDYAPAHVTGEGLIASGWSPKFLTDYEMIKKLATSPITDIKVTLNGKEILLPKITSKQTKDIMATAACLTR